MVIGLTQVLVLRSNRHKSLNVVQVAVQPPKTYMELSYVHAECECLFPIVGTQYVVVVVDDDDKGQFHSKDPEAIDLIKCALLCCITSVCKSVKCIYIYIYV